MRLHGFCAPVLYAVWLLCGDCCRAQTVTHLQAAGEGFLAVQVSINGSGPYAFLLDTGANRTLVRKDLLEAAGIALGVVAEAHLATGMSNVHPAVVSSLAVERLAVHDLAVEGIDGGDLERLGRFQGVLGDDFLKHFDVLIDNQAKTLTLDEGAELAQRVSGDRLALSFSGMRNGRATADRLVFDLKLPALGETRRFLLDSGANHMAFFPDRALPLQRRASENRAGRGGTLSTFGGSGRCYTGIVPVAIGKQSLPAVELVFCEGMRANMDVDGILPTTTFTRLFFSHSGSYAIANPRVRKSSGGLF